MPPVSETGEFGYLEVPQVLKRNGCYYLLFSVSSLIFSQGRKIRSVLETGTHYLVSDTLLGPYLLLEDKFLCGDAQGSLYSGKFIEDPAGGLVFLAFENYSSDDRFIGSLSDPYPVTIFDDHRLEIDFRERFVLNI